ncbi:MAG TPA: phosphohistidine phosphatase SixA [Methanoregula sp.]|nr:phosphohistidine phosphatase SixA [Methanoregula sp.]
MDLYMLRHGRAGPSTGDPGDSGRTLTGAGKKEIRGIARAMRAGKFRIDAIATSPLPRAAGTAEIVARVLGMEDRVETWDELAPGGDMDSVCYRAAQYGAGEAVLICGHEPMLSSLISRIVTGHDNASIILTKGGVAKIRNYCFDRRPEGELQWLLTPKQLMAMR